MMTLREELNGALLRAVREVAGEGVEIAMDRVVFGPTKAPEHGDLATSAALMLAKPLGRKPAEVAGELARRLGELPHVASAEVAMPGFVNIRLAPSAFAAVLDAVRAEGAGFGTCTVGGGRSVLLEFVSANPTGPMHIGHCRHAATGDALARILEAAGYRVTREFYINDAGVQVKALGVAFHWRCLEALGALRPDDVVQEPHTDDEGVTFTVPHFRGEKIQYSGEYLADFAKQFVAGKSVADIESLTRDELAWAARTSNLDMIQSDLAALGVMFDNYVSERAIHDSGAVERTVEQLRASGNVYEKDDATWLKTTDYGDDQDRVLIKGDGTFTYLVPDVAYHHDKFLRGFDRYINVFGADHGGYPPRLRAGIANLGHDHTKLDVLFLRLVFLRRDGRRVKFSKRAGNFVAMADVVEEAGPAPTRWFMLSRSIDSEFDFDMDLALDHTSRNPVYKVLYAHARICTMAEKGRDAGIHPATNSAAAVAQLGHPLEKEIMLFLAGYPEIVERAARELAPHHLPAYLLALADFLNRYYSLARTEPSFRILQDTDSDRQAARLAMLDAARQVLANGTLLLGITAPERLDRAVEEAEEVEPV